MNQRILISGGGTAGSVTPLLGIVQYLRQADPRIEFLFVGTASGPEQSLAEAAGIEFKAIPAGKLRRYWSWRNLADWRQVWAGFQAAQRILRDWPADIVLSAGSYVSVPMVWAARAAGKKVLIHQQDVQPGLANRLMNWAATRITVSFGQSVKFFPKWKTSFTGNPVRPDILQGSRAKAQSLFRLKPNLPTILILGGSTGSQFINNIVGATAYRLVRFCQMIHITGSHRDFVELADDQYHRYDFLTWEISHAMAAADIVVTRVGLGTLTELAALSKPCIFIPMPHTHQEANASLLTELNAGIILNQDTLQPPEFIKTIQRLLDHPDDRGSLGRNLHQIYRPDATERIGQIILKMLAV